MILKVSRQLFQDTNVSIVLYIDNKSKRGTNKNS